MTPFSLKQTTKQKTLEHIVSSLQSKNIFLVTYTSNYGRVFLQFLLLLVYRELLIGIDLIPFGIKYNTCYPKPNIIYQNDTPPYLKQNQKTTPLHNPMLS